MKTDKTMRTKSEIWIPLALALILPIFYFYYGRAGAYDLFFAAQGSDLNPASMYYEWSFGILFFSFVPLLTWTGVLGYPLKDIGFRTGRLLPAAALFTLSLILLLGYAFVATRFDEFHAAYPRFKYIGMENMHVIIRYYALALVFFFARELFFRGFLVQGLKDQLGMAAAILISTLAAAPMFAGASILEGTIAILVNLMYGFIAVRTGSFMYSALISWIWMIAVDWSIIYGL